MIFRKKILQSQLCSPVWAKRLLPPLFEVTMEKDPLAPFLLYPVSNFMLPPVPEPLTTSPLFILTPPVWFRLLSPLAMVTEPVCWRCAEPVIKDREPLESAHFPLSAVCTKISPEGPRLLLPEAISSDPPRPSFAAPAIIGLHDLHCHQHRHPLLLLLSKSCHRHRLRH